MAKPKASKEDNTKNLGLKVEGDLGDLQIIPPGDSDDDESTANDNTICAKQAETVTDLCNIIQTSNPSVVGSVAITNSENVIVGNSTHFHGPVTIKQIISKTGVENASYTRTDDENVQPEEFKPTQKYEVSSTKKIRIRPWLKITISATSVIIICIVLTLALVIQDKKSPKESSSDPVSEPTSESNYGTVVGVWYENIAYIMFSVILVPLTIILVLYPLLTTQTSTVDIDDSKAYPPLNTIPDTTLNVPNRLTKDIPKADGLLIAPNHLRIVSRSDWLAQPVENELDKIRQPVPWVIISHTATESCQSQSECVLRVRLIQMFHIESREWDDIGYNFLVAGDGSAYFGRGWDYIGAHTLGYNKYSIGISFIGTFNNEAPPQKQIEACQKLIKLGVQIGKLSKDYKLFAHRQLSSTKSPGDKLYDIIKTWPHFVNDTSNISELIPKY